MGAKGQSSGSLHPAGVVPRGELAAIAEAQGADADDQATLDLD